MKYKAIMLDVDGTTVHNRRDALPSKKVSTAIAEASKVLHVGLATSRAYFLAKPVLDHLQLSGPSIIKGGACIIDLTTNKILIEHALSKEDFRVALDTFISNNLSFWIQDNEKNRMYDPHEIYEKPIDIVADAVDLAIAEHIKQSLANKNTLAVHIGPSWQKGKVWISISNAHATKQQGILEVAKLLGISTTEIIGVGDGQNDFPLLMACGLKVAMGNAVEDLKAIADYIAPSVEDDGVADVIEKFVLS